MSLSAVIEQTAKVWSVLQNSGIVTPAPYNICEISKAYRGTDDDRKDDSVREFIEQFYQELERDVSVGKNDLFHLRIHIFTMNPIVYELFLSVLAHLKKMRVSVVDEYRQVIQVCGEEYSGEITFLYVNGFYTYIQ